MIQVIFPLNCIHYVVETSLYRISLLYNFCGNRQNISCIPIVVLVNMWWVISVYICIRESYIKAENKWDFQSYLGLPILRWSSLVQLCWEVLTNLCLYKIVPLPWFFTSFSRTHLQDGWMAGQLGTQEECKVKINITCSLKIQK